jgi:HD-GYP domain-containing protein (c-di-GMP phosphodiesterase class II)
MQRTNTQSEFLEKLITLASETLGVEFLIIDEFEETASGLEQQQQQELFKSSGNLVQVETASIEAGVQILFKISTDFGKVTIGGSLSAKLDEWIIKLVNSTANLLDKEIVLTRCSLFLDEYSAQISRDFEELVWTRDLAVQLQQSDIRVPISKLVQEVFSSLLQTVQASQIFVFQYSRPIGRAAPIPEVDKRSLQSFGSGPVSAQSIPQILSEFGRQARQKIVVNNHPHSLGIEDLASFILLPIQNHDSEFGWILVVNRADDCSNTNYESEEARNEFHQDEFGTFEAGILQSTSIALATQAKNTFLHCEEEELLIGIVRALINAVDAKDPDTRGHSDRVAKVSRRLAQELGFEEQKCEQVYLAGLLHDIGKIGISDNVLLKRDSLTHEEYEHLKLHPVIGYNVLKDLDRVSYVLPGVLYHHETYDGRGYPEGLVAEEIPLIARIIAVADAFDAMTSDRPYRKGIPISEAENRLKENRGPQWDPDVIAAFFSSTDDIYEISFSDQKSDGKLQKKNVDFDFITHAVGLTH